MTAAILVGTVESVASRDAKTRFVVAHLRLATGMLVTIRGALFGVRVGVPLQVAGAWVDDPRWGRQFAVEAYAHEREPGDEAAARTEDAMAFLRREGVAEAYATRISKRYGTETASVVSTDPYRLAREVWGVGFPVADSIAVHLGVARDVPERLEAGLLHVHRLATQNGDIHVPDSEVLASAAKLLEVDARHLPSRLVALEVANLIVRETLGDRGACSSLPVLHAAEVDAAVRLAVLAQSPVVPIASDIGGAIDSFEAAASLQLAEQQRCAVKAALQEACTVITGGPGSGKTSSVKAIVHIACANGKRVVLAAPTGRAAKRLAEAADTEALTVHRLLEYQPLEATFRKSASDPLVVDLLVVDEASLIDLPLFRALLAALAPGTRLVLVGDVDQLPSVGPGNVLGDVIASGAAAVIRLTEIYRQAAESQIVLAAHQINAGKLPDLVAPSPRPDALPASDFFFIQREDPEVARALIVDLVADRIPARFDIADAQVLAPRHRGALGIIALNQALQARLNPHDGSAELVRGDHRFRRGDRVMQLRNDYRRGVYNGDTGMIESIDLAERVVCVDFGGSITTTYEERELDQLVHAYASSVHRVQGSEYPAVVIALATEHYVMLQRRLIYTAVTRGKRLVVVVGSKRAFATAVRAQGRTRHTYLAERVRHLATPGVP